MGSSKNWQRNCSEDIDNSSGQMQGRVRRCNQQVGSVLLQLRAHSNSCNLSRHSGHFTFGLLVRKTTRRDMHTYLFELWEYNCWYLVHHVMLLKRNVCVVRKPLDLAKYNSPVEPLLSGPWERPKCWSLLDPRSSWALIWAKYGSLVLYSPLFNPQMCALPQRSHD